MEFNDENQYRRAAPAPKPKSWPIKLALKYGAKSEEQANIIAILVSVILILITIIIYKNLFFSSDDTVDIDEVPPEVRFEMEAAGIDLSEL